MGNCPTRSCVHTCAHTGIELRSNRAAQGATAREGFHGAPRLRVKAMGASQGSGRRVCCQACRAREGHMQPGWGTRAGSKPNSPPCRQACFVGHHPCPSLPFSGLSGWGQGDQEDRAGACGSGSSLSEDRSLCCLSADQRDLSGQGCLPMATLLSHSPQSLPQICSCGLSARRDPPSRLPPGHLPRPAQPLWLRGLSPKPVASRDSGLQLGPS